MTRWILTCVLAACASTAPRVPTGTAPHAPTTGTAPHAPTTGSAPLASLAWMRGRWCGPFDGGTFCESWREGDHGTLVGEGTVDHGDMRIAFETLRLEVRGGVVFYVATPAGEGTTAFRLTRETADEVVFENPEHDFPKRITYRRGPHDALVAIVEGGARRIEFAMTRTAPGAPATLVPLTPRPRPLDTALRCREVDPADAGGADPSVTFALNSGGDQGQLVQAGLALVLDGGGRSCSAQVASCDHAQAGEGAFCDGDPVCARFVGDAVVVERRGVVIFRDRAPNLRYADDGAVLCRP